MAKFTRKRMGELLIEAGAISEAQLNEAVLEQKTSHKRIGQVMIDKGFITEEKLVEILEHQLGIPQVNLYNYNIDPEVATSIPMYLAQRYQVIPIEKRDGKLLLAMADPMNLIALDDVAMITGEDVEPVIASASAINHAVNQFFGLKESLELTIAERKGHLDEDEELARLKSLVEDAPIVKVVNSLIQQAVNEGASDIHIEPSVKGMRVRLRIDGVLHDVMQPPKDTQPLIVSRIKIMANLDIAERRLPQDGRIQIQAGLKDVNLRVSTLPTIHGEKVVIRILDKERIILPLDKLGLSKGNYQSFKQLLMNHSGMLLVTGPTGCGKTTTLYSALNYLNRSEDNIITVEDPVEYRLEGINQIQVNPRIRLTFAGALRAILRQDPNIIMVGEIRDLETAEMATRAALTGHLVLSTLHTNDAVRAVSRLIDMGVESYLITSSLIGVVAQRLVRVICAGCRERYSMPPEEQVLYARIFNQEPPAELYRGVGCRSCNHTGYRGRSAIHEILTINQDVRRLILQGATSDMIQELVLQQGMATMIEDGLNRIQQGETTLEEVVRVAFSTSSIDSALTPLQSASTAPFRPALLKGMAAAASGIDLSQAAISVEVSGPYRVRPEEEICFTFMLHNPGTVPLSGVTVTAPLFGEDWSCAAGELAPGETANFFADYTVPRDASAEINCSAVAAGQFGSTRVTAQSSCAVQVAQPELRIVKRGPGQAEPGDVITFAFTVTNTGDVPLSDIAVTDPLFGDDWSYMIGELAPGAEVAFTMDYAVPVRAEGILGSRATATGRFEELQIAGSGDCVVYLEEMARPALAIAVEAPQSARPGETVVYRFTVSNTGKVPLSGVKVTNPLFGAGWCNSLGSLLPERSLKFTFNYTLPLEAEGRLVNAAYVTGLADGEMVTAQAGHTLAVALPESAKTG